MISILSYIPEKITSSLHVVMLYLKPMLTQIYMRQQIACSDVNPSAVNQYQVTVGPLATVSHNLRRISECLVDHITANQSAEAAPMLRGREITRHYIVLKLHLIVTALYSDKSL